MNFDKTELYYIKSQILGTRVSLFDLAQWKNGLAFKKIHFSDDGVPIIKIAELNNGINSKTAYTQNKYSRDVHLKRGDLLFAWSGNPETSIDIFKFNLREGWLNQHIFKVTPNEKLVTRDFFYFIMKFLKPYFTKIATNKQTTGLGHVTIADLKRINFICPPLETQKKIAAVLSALDDKIELNNAINKNLEEQAQTIFKSWFIDFEPFGGTMPDDWRIEELDNVTLMSAGGDKPLIISKEQTDDCPYPIYSNGISENGLYGYTDKAIINEESVTVSARGTIGFVCLRQTPYFPIVRLITLIPKKSVMSSKYLYLWLKNITIEGTGTTQQQLTIPLFKRTKILLPRYEVLERFTNMVNPSFEIAISNQLENKKLGEIRDALLPRLMNGEIDVSNVKI